MKSINSKLFLISLVSIALAVTASVVIMYSGSKGVIDDIVVNDTEAAMNTLLIKTDEMKKSSYELATLLAQDDDVRAAIESQDKDRIIATANEATLRLRADTEFITITDANGIALARTHSDSSGDSVTNQQNVREALKGNAASYIEPGTQIKLSVRSSSPVKDDSGRIIGAISTGYALDNTDFADQLKESANAEFTVFLYDERINTTIMKDGERQIGTKLSEAVAKIVIDGKQSYHNEANILGKNYYTSYEPIISDSGEVLGIFFAGKPIDDIMNQVTQTTLFAIIIVVILSAALLLATRIIIQKLIAGPIKKMSETAIQLSEGNLQIENLTYQSNDEIGELTRATRKLADTLLLLIQDMDTMANEFEGGDIDAKMDVSRFQGSYRTVAEGVNDMTGNLISELMMFMHCIKEFGNGNFDSDIPRLPGKKAIMNNDIDAMRSNLKSVADDIGSLVSAASIGKLNSRAKTDKYKGDWAGLLNQLNKLMEEIAAPIAEAQDVLKQVSSGNFDHKVEGQYQGDFLLIKNSINNTVTNVASYIEEISTVLRSLSMNDLDQAITRDYMGKFSEIKDALNNIIEKFNIIISEIYSAAEQVTAGARQISESSMTLAQGAAEQAASVEELNATILTINESTANNAQDAKQAEVLSAGSKDNALKGDHDMNNMLTSMDGINTASNNIAKIIKVIDDIATQTNLLALNASVEAARAGEHGKGFAVVAEEVRNLAARSQAAAKETSQMIEESINRVEQGTQIANTTANALRTIVDDASKVADIITSISEASNQQASAIAQVTIGLSQITDVVQHNSATSEESASASQELSSQAEVLRNLVGSFKLKRMG